LLDLNVIIADVTTSMRYASAARVLSTSRNDLRDPVLSYGPAILARKLLSNPPPSHHR
jgi:hypothetical protein